MFHIKCDNNFKLINLTDRFVTVGPDLQIILNIRAILIAIISNF